VSDESFNAVYGDTTSVSNFELTVSVSGHETPEFQEALLMRVRDYMNGGFPPLRSDVLWLCRRVENLTKRVTLEGA